MIGAWTEVKRRECMEVGFWWTNGGIAISFIDSVCKMQISLVEGFNLIFIGLLGLPVEVLVVVRSIRK